MEKGRKTVSSNRRNNGGDTGGGGGGNTSTEKTNDLKNGESFEGPSKRKSKSQSLIVSRGSKSKVEDPEVAARMKRQTKKRTQDLMRMEANDQMSCVNAEAKRRTRTKRTAAGI
uniref:Uncharacterized protein n=1 Tax=Panagrolaimus superbus TaxID=310955 RepID=A0A914Y5Y5_9BILA